MKRLLTLSCIWSICYASDPYGTPDRPQINGNSYDVHQVYIEPNQGYQPQLVDNALHTTKAQRITIKQPDNNINFQSDNWATNFNVEKALRQAANDGKLNYVLNQAQKSNLPASVAIVPIVESNYNKDAVSPQGAAGAWQLMPSVAHDYGLKDRFNFTASTRVAIQLLGDLHNEFDNWALTFAAYNCGRQCVRNALASNPDATSIDDLRLPQETKDYVHKIVWMNQIIAGLDEKHVN